MGLWLAGFHATQEIKQRKQGKSKLQIDFFVITCPKSKTRNIRPPTGNEDRLDLVP